MSTREQLLREIEAFLEETGMMPTTFGEKATNDRALMTTLRKGRDPKSSTVDAIRDYIIRERAERASSKRGRSSQAASATA